MAASLIVAVVAMLPGFALPFVLPLLLIESAADTYLVAFGVALTLWNVVVNNLELNTVSEVGRVARNSIILVDRGVLRIYFRKSLGFSFKITSSFGILLVLVYCVLRSDFSHLVVAGFVALLIPLVGSASSVYSGILIAAGRSNLAVASQGLRGVVGLLCIYPATHFGIWIISAGMVIGEVIRCFVLSRGCRALIGVSDKSVLFDTSGLAWQSSATATAQSSPLIDRVFLGWGDAGSIVAYEIADKLLFSVVQFLNLSILIRIVGQWSRIGQLSYESAKRSVTRGLLAIFAASLLSGLAMIAVMLVALRAGFIPSEWTQGVQWGFFLLASLPLVMLNSTYGRLLILLDKQRLLIRFAAVSVVANVLFDSLFFAIMGPIGIVVATCAVRLANVCCYVVYFERRGWHALAKRASAV
ncbi:polysaccharide biosynthesis C-terminal domain-containing protein [Rhodococcoides fascians]|uniref:polysaccharide biosynthesis C-terminal domain-containing protein n=1 Tax=Rhodococcoides fascians TaxID=1828 RepID=UPI0024BAC10A|nr:polysaccharide biosynthesis C-terminal domain-containing protein [Rhodococcus fascians]MDJ0467305.1 polysaccharide biosynthesis C-terminal domain-containing protein [Rhodococcus fascians]